MTPSRCSPGPRWLARLAEVYLRDRMANLGLFAAACVAWTAVAALFATRSPTGEPGVLLSGALLLGAAGGLTMAPLFWLAAFARKGRIAYRGDWIRALRRGALVGLVIALFVMLRGQEAFSPPIAIFVVVMAVFVELILTLQR